MKSEAVFFTAAKTAEVREIEVPDPGTGEVQAETLINGICMWEVWQYNHASIQEAFVPGHEGIGVVTRVGKDVTGVREGDYITTCEWSRYTNQKANTFIKLAKKPADVESYLPEPLACVVNAAAHTDIYPGDRILLFGTGYMGLLLVQLLSRYPLSHLTAVDIKQKNLELALEYGADEIINPQTAEGKKRLEELAGDPFEISYECSGARDPLDWCTKLTKRGGKLGIFAWHHQPRTFDTNIWHDRGLSILNLTPGITANERRFRSFEAAERLLSAGKINQEKLVTHKYRLADIGKAMEESTLRTGEFIKSILRF